ETKNEYHIYVTSTDNDSKTFSKALVVYINDVQEATTSYTNFRQTAQYKVYPNPAGDYLIIEMKLPENGPVSIELVDVYGKLIQTYQYATFMTGGTHEERLHLDPAVSPGCYFVIIRYNYLRKCIPVIKN
ncbi:MAG: T9SS type A sorting domain-containing protein, partial [Bacteroidota bacterium]